MSTEYTSYVAELSGGNSNRQVALMAAVQFYANRSSLGSHLVVPLAEKFLTFLEEN